MKKNLNFDVDAIESLEGLLRTGLRGYATNAEQLGGLSKLWIFFCNGTAMEIHSVMTDVGNWEEVGTLVFRLVTKNDNLPEMIPLPSTWACISSVEKLVFDEVEFSAESGLAIYTCSGEILIVICGANVYTIQIEAPFFVGDFLPEHDIVRYKRVAL